MLSEFPSALRDVLESRGVMGDMRARMRTEVFRALDDKVVHVQPGNLADTVDFNSGHVCSAKEALFYWLA